MYIYLSLKKLKDIKGWNININLVACIMNNFMVEHTGLAKGNCNPEQESLTFHNGEVSHSNDPIVPVEYLALHDSHQLVLSLNISLSTETITLIRGKYYRPQLRPNRQLLPQ